MCRVCNGGMVRFVNRADAGRRLAPLLSAYANDPNVVLLALPRGGVPVAYELARALRAPLDVYVVRKLGVPGHEELAMGAVASDGSYVIDEETIALAHVSPADLERTLARELEEVRRRERAYRDDRPAPALDGKTIIVVDDGLATGASMYSALRALRERHPAQIVVAVPVGSEDSLRQIRLVADRVVCPVSERVFGAVGRYYDDFGDVSDGEVRDVLARAAREYHQWNIAV